MALATLKTWPEADWPADAPDVLRAAAACALDDEARQAIEECIE